MSKPVILCVDDEKIILDSLEEQLLNNLGNEFDLELAESAQEGLEIIDELQQEQRQLAVVLSDQIMPGKKGDEFLADVYHASPGTHNILLTGQASLQAVQNAINHAKLYRYISKPWEANDLIMTVAEAGRSFVQKQQLDLFSQSNRLLRSLNQATQDLSSVMEQEQLFRKFIVNAVSSAGADHGYLLLKYDGELRLATFSAQTPELYKNLYRLYQEQGEQLAQRLSEKIQRWQPASDAQDSNGQQRENQPYVLLPLNLNGGYEGYLLLENDASEEVFLDIQHEILQMLLSQLNISLDKAQLYSRLETKTQELQDEKEKVEQVNELLEDKNQDIIDSINYARRIQESILPAHETFAEVFPESFVLYLPKDIVSGDFYWWARRGDVLLFAAVDCTGHGVPGAFMSVIASNLLNEVARMRSMTKVDDMLNYLDDRMRHILKQNDADPSRTGTLDGMDLAFCYYDLNSNVLQYAGAYRPLFMVRNGELYEYEATRTSIAGGGPMDAKREFEQNILEPQPGDAFYIFSDGFPDQFGGPNNRKFSKRQLKRTIESLAEQPMAEQQREIRRIFDEWKGEREQIDDVLLMGFRFQQ